MSFSITEADVWPRIARAIEAEIRERADELRTITVDRLVRVQARIEALQWVLDESKPKDRGE